MGWGQCCFFSREPQKCPWTSIFSQCSRVLFCVHGHFFRKIHGQVNAFTGSFLDIFTGSFHGSRARFFKNVHGHTLRFTGRVWFPSSNIHGHFSMFTGTLAKNWYSKAWKSNVICPKSISVFFNVKIQVSRETRFYSFSWFF